MNRREFTKGVVLLGMEANAFVDSTGYGHLAAFAGAKYSEPNDYAVANSIGVAGIDLDKVVEYVKSNGGAANLAYGLHDGVPGKVVRLDGPRGEGKMGVLEGRHFDDDIMAYGFHDMAPRLQIKNGGTYGIPYKALRVAGIENLLAVGMMITSNHNAHMSTRNTVCCMGQGQGAGTAAALCAARNCGTRELPYPNLRDALLTAGVYLES